MEDKQVIPVTSLPNSSGESQGTPEAQGTGANPQASALLAEWGAQMKAGGLKAASDWAATLPLKAFRLLTEELRTGRQAQ